MRITRFFILLLATITFSATFVRAEELDSLRQDRVSFYVGAHAGSSIAESNFTSFGVDKFRPGWNAGINAGYRFTSTWSLELVASWNHLSLSVQDCCIDYNYFLGSDLKRYHPELIPSNMNGLYYNDILSRTFVQRYGLQVNLNLLGIFDRTKKGPWRLEVSPNIYAVNTHSNLLDRTSKASFQKNIVGWHLGYGGQLFSSYTLTENMLVGIYGGYTQYFGKQIDGLPRIHSTNYTVDAGIKFIYTFNRKGEEKTSDFTIIIPDISSFVPNDSITTLYSEPSIEEPDTISYSTVTTDTTIVETLIAPVLPSEEKNNQFQESPFPIIYFSFNSVWIEPSQRAKLKDIANKMKEDCSIRIRITGWGDEIGGDEVNKHVSLLRAEAVKQRLEQWLIPADRIEIVGGGIAYDAPTRKESRSATIIILTE